jgi:hypothetical protein
MLDRENIRPPSWQRRIAREWLWWLASAVVAGVYGWRDVRSDEAANRVLALRMGMTPLSPEPFPLDVILWAVIGGLLIYFLLGLVRVTVWSIRTAARR